MKSDDFPGKPKTFMKGIRNPVSMDRTTSDEPVPMSSRAAMIAMSRQSGIQASSDVQSYVQEGESLITGTLQEISNESIVVSPYQPRLIFDTATLEDLATSIQTIGQVKPILVRPLEDGRFEIVGGERRWRAVKLIGWETIQAIVKPMSDGVAMVLALTDNEQEELCDYERGKSYSQIIGKGEETSMRALARRVGVNHSTVSRCLLLMQLPKPVIETLDANPRLITANYAKRFIDYCANHANVVCEVVSEMVNTNLSQEAAIRLIDKKIKTLDSSKPEVKSDILDLPGIGTIKIVGRKVELHCFKGIDPKRLSSQLESFLQTIDKEYLIGPQN